MKRLEKYMDIRKKKHKQNNDTVGVIDGLEGIGKSTLALHMIEYWQKINFGEVKASDVKHMGLTKEMFVEDLSDSNPNEITVFDEAGELSSRRSLSKFNNAIMQAYTIIRADKIFTVLVLPDFWILDSYFRNHRVKFLARVYRRGRFAFWLKDDISKINAINQYRMIRSPFVTRPRFLDTFPIYKGVMKSKYGELKVKKTQETRKKLPQIFFGDTVKKIYKNEDLETARWKGMRDAGLSYSQIGRIEDRPRQTIHMRLTKSKSIKNI